MDKWGKKYNKYDDQGWWVLELIKNYNLLE